MVCQGQGLVLGPDLDPHEKRFRLYHYFCPSKIIENLTFAIVTGYVLDLNFEVLNSTRLPINTNMYKCLINEKL